MATNGKPKGECRFEGCDKDVWHDELEICYVCYSGLRYWRDRPIHHVRSRVQQLTKLQDRMSTFMVGDIPKSKLPVRKTRAQIAAEKQKK